MILPMSDEHSSPSPSAPPPPTDADYEAIAAAIMETVRGRWLLAEYAKRSRNADTELILKGLGRIETLLRDPPAVSSAERVRIDLMEMAKAIARTRSEIAAIRPDGEAKGTLSEASEELDSIVHTTEQATSDILAAAEQVQEIAWTLRERGADGILCDALDRRANAIYSACSFQDLTGQRTRKVVEVLQFLEERIRAMIAIWGGAVSGHDDPPAVAAPHVGEDRSVPHLEQGEIDRMMPSARPLTAPVAASPDGFPAGDGLAVAASLGHAMPEAAIAADTPAAAQAVATVETAIAPMPTVVGATALALDPAPPEVARQPEPAPAPEPEPEPTPEVSAQAEPAPQVAAAAGEPRDDPAVVLKRILAIIRAPSETASAAPATAEASAAPTADMPAEPAPPQAEIAQTVAAVMMPLAEVADLPVADVAASEIRALDIAVADDGPPEAATAPTQEPAEDSAPTAAVVHNEVADDIPAPMAGLVTVDQAVDELLTRGSARAAPHGRADALPLVEPQPAEPPAAAAEPVAVETEPDAPEPGPFLIGMPEFTVAREPEPAPAPQAEMASELLPVAEAAATPIPQPAEPAPPAAAFEAPAEPPPATLPAEPAPAVAQAVEVEPVAAAAIAAELAPPPEPRSPVAAPAEQPTPSEAAAGPRPVPRQEAIDAIAALSDDEKIALFS